MLISYILYSFCMLLYPFYMIVYGFIWFNIVFIRFYIVLYDFLEVGPQFSNDSFFWPLTFGRILNSRPEIRTFDWKFQLPQKFSNDPFFLTIIVWPDFECSTGNANVRPEIPTTTEIFQWPVFLTMNVWPEIRTFEHLGPGPRNSMNSP